MPRRRGTARVGIRVHPKDLLKAREIIDSLRREKRWEKDVLWFPEEEAEAAAARKRIKDSNHEQTPEESGYRISKWTIFIMWATPPVAIFLLCAFMTGGLVFVERHDFGYSQMLDLADGVRCGIFLSPSWRTRLHIPFVFKYDYGGRPYEPWLEVRCSPTAYTKCRSIEVSEIDIKYEDGKVVQKKVVWSGRLRPPGPEWIRSARARGTEILMLHHMFGAIVERHADVEITMTGHLARSDRTKSEFSVTGLFKASSDKGLCTRWDELGAI